MLHQFDAVLFFITFHDNSLVDTVTCKCSLQHETLTGGCRWRWNGEKKNTPHRIKSIFFWTYLSGNSDLTNHSTPHHSTLSSVERFFRQWTSTSTCCVSFHIQAQISTDKIMPEEIKEKLLNSIYRSTKRIRSTHFFFFFFSLFQIWC